MSTDTGIRGRSSCTILLGHVDSSDRARSIWRGRIGQGKRGVSLETGGGEGKDAIYVGRDRQEVQRPSSSFSETLL